MVLGKWVVWYNSKENINILGKIRHKIQKQKYTDFFKNNYVIFKKDWNIGN